MSKRYGRNQKRKAREQIARLEFDKYELQRKIEDNRSTISTAKNIISLAHKINPNSVVFSPSRHLRGEHYIYSVDPLFNPLVDFRNSRNPNSMVDIRTIDLYDLEVELYEHEFKDAVHFECVLTNPHKGTLKSAYRISAEGFKYQPTDRIVEELVRHLKHNVGGVN